MARQKDQKMRFNDAELSLIKSFFAENDDLLFLIRKVMYQFELEKDEVKQLESIRSESFSKLLNKVFLPSFEPDAPMFQMADMIMGLQVDMKTLGVEAMEPLIRSKAVQIDYIRQQLDYLCEGVESNDIKLTSLAVIDDSNIEKTYINIHARNYISSYIDSNIQQLQFLAGKKDETVAETMERLQKNSNK